MIVLVANAGAEPLKQRVDFAFISGDEGPSGPGFELIRKVSQTLWSINRRVYAN